MVAADRAKDFPKKPVYVMGMGESAEMTMISQMHDFTSSRAFVTSGQEAFKMAEIERSDVDHIMIYDAFAHLPIFAMEDLGFLKKGEAGPWFAEMKSAPGGELPVALVGDPEDTDDEDGPDSDNSEDGDDESDGPSVDSLQALASEESTDEADGIPGAEAEEN